MKTLSDIISYSAKGEVVVVVVVVFFFFFSNLANFITKEKTGNMHYNTAYVSKKINKQTKIEKIYVCILYICYNTVYNLTN